MPKGMSKRCREEKEKEIARRVLHARRMADLGMSDAEDEDELKRLAGECNECHMSSAERLAKWIRSNRLADLGIDDGASASEDGSESASDGES